MALEYIYDTRDQIPEGYADLYTEKDGKFVLTEVNGIKTPEDVERVQTALRKERDEHKGTKDKLRSFGDLNPEEARKAIDRLPELEALVGKEGDLEKKIEEAASARVKAATAPLERKLNEVQEERDRLSSERDSFEMEIRNRTFRDVVGSAARKAKVQSSAVDDIVVVARDHFEEVDGKLVTKEGAPVGQGLDPTAYFKEMERHRPHWWPVSEGGGARGGSGAPGGKNPFSHENWNLTEQGRIYRSDPKEADRLAKAAGTSVGGARPAPKK